MKNKYIILMLIALLGKSTFIYCQDYGGSVWVESMPIFKGDLIEFVKNHLKYPSQALTDSVEGVVFISCWVDTTGKTTKHVVLKGVRDDLNKEALRVTSLVKFAKPAIQGGKPVCIEYTIPVVFKLPKKKERKCKSR